MEPDLPRRAWELGLPQWPVSNVVVSPRLVSALGTVAAAGGGVLIGLVAVTFGPVPAAGLLGAMVAGVVIACDARAGLWVVLAVAALLPFAVVPVKVVLTPALLETASAAVLGVWILSSLLQRDRMLPVPHVAGLWVAVLLVVTLFAFVLGVGRGYTTQTYHDYLKFVLGLLLFFVVWSTTQTLDDARRLLTVLLVVSGLAALLGLLLYAAGPQVTFVALARLIPYGYPSERIVRYIEDDPAKPMRLTSTSVDPNSFAGLLAMVLVLAVVQGVARRPVVPRWLSLGMAAVVAPALLLTYSRAGWLGAATGIAAAAVLRYRWVLVPSAVVLASALALGLGRVFVQRLWVGFTLQDPATQMRLEEYRTALAIIREYPLFGVGFGEAPTVTLWTGVSSIYLTVAERMGLLGLAAFLLAVGSIALAGLRAWRARPNEPIGDLLLALVCAQAAALLIGLFDHYFFNISFPHMTTFFWTIHASILAVSQQARCLKP
jgi:O-antigen ligase